MATERTTLLGKPTGHSYSTVPEETINLRSTNSILNSDMPDASYNETSVYSQGTDILTGASNTVDIRDLLVTLERASSIVRAHVEQQDGGGNSGRRKPKPLIPRWITSYLIVITFIWQALNVGFLEIIKVVVDTDTDIDNKTKAEVNLSSNIVMTVFQAAHIILVFFVTFKLAKQVMHKTASGSLLAQSYLSTVLLFAGLYTLEYRFQHDAWEFVEPDPSSSLRPVLLFLRMLYFSTSTATLCGTSLIEPIEWYAGLTVSLQMLTSFVYFASILSLVMIPRKRSRFDPPPGPLRSCTRILRRCLFREND